jgi:hypothetical protein
LLHIAPIRAYLVVPVDHTQLKRQRSLGESRSPIVDDLRFARKHRFRCIGFLGDYHLDHALLRLALRKKARLGIDFKRAAAAGMPHQFLNDLHILVQPCVLCA